MELEQLKAEADKLGYRLVKKPAPLPKLMPCSQCGTKPRKWIGRDGYFYKCEKCGTKSTPSPYDRAAMQGHVEQNA